MSSDGAGTTERAAGMSIDGVVSRACERVPGLVRGALVYLPEGFLLGATRGAAMLDLEPLIRCAARCFAVWVRPVLDGKSVAPFVEYVFVIHDQIVAVQGGRRDTRVALAATCTRDHNVAFVLSATRLAMAEVESVVDLGDWGL